MIRHLFGVGVLALLAGQLCLAQEGGPPAMDTLKPLMKIDWRLGPDYPMGIQDSAVGVINGYLVSAGGFTRHPLNILEKYPDAFGGAPEGSGFTKLSFALDLSNEEAGWQQIPDLPGHARQGGSVAVVDNAMYVMGGISYDEPLTYRDTYRLSQRDGRWLWRKLRSCELPWPVYGASDSTVVIGKKIYMYGVADFFQSPGTPGHDFHSEAGRGGSPVGKALLMLDTENLDAGWQRLADCPGVPQFDAGVAGAGKLYRLGGIYGPLSAWDGYSYLNAVDSWVYDPGTDSWSQLADMPHGSNRRGLTYRDRYVVLVAGYMYERTWNLDGTVTNVYTDAERAAGWKGHFEDTVLVYDTVTKRLGTADRLLEATSIPSAAIVGDTIYTLGGEGGPRLWHPATLQIGKIKGVVNP